MKKITFFIAISFISLFSFSQTDLTTAVDFTKNDINGIERHLFGILDSGQYVLIDFFYTTWSSCQSTAPYIKQTYEDYGCNNKNVFVISIDIGNSQAECITFDNDYNLEFPTIAGDDGGSTICNTYNIGAYPTFILIAPDHSIVEQDMWPINSASDFDAYLQSHGLQHESCETSNITNVNSNQKINIFPNPTNGNFKLTFNCNGNAQIKVINMLGEIVYQENVFSTGEFSKIINLEKIKNGIYFVNIKTQNNNFVKKLKLQ